MLCGVQTPHTPTSSHTTPHLTPTHTPLTQGLARIDLCPVSVAVPACCSPLLLSLPAVQVSIYKPATASSFDQRFYYICLSYIGADALPPGFLRRLTSHCSRFRRYMCTAVRACNPRVSLPPSRLFALPVVQELMVGIYCTCAVDSV